MKIVKILILVLAAALLFVTVWLAFEPAQRSADMFVAVTHHGQHAKYFMPGGYKGDDARIPVVVIGWMFAVTLFPVWQIIFKKNKFCKD